MMLIVISNQITYAWLYAEGIICGTGLKLVFLIIASRQGAALLHWEGGYVFALKGGGSDGSGSARYYSDPV